MLAAALGGPGCRCELVRHWGGAVLGFFAEALRRLFVMAHWPGMLL